MKERPILFSAAMVRANRENRKTQTRRTRGLEKINGGPDAWTLRGEESAGVFVFEHVEVASYHLAIRSPYGGAGDRLWTRETWQGIRRIDCEYDKYEDLSKHHRGDLTINGYADHYGKDSIVVFYESDDAFYTDSWLPSIHMPRWASRDTLEVVSVRTERLQSITEADARAEGSSIPSYELEWAETERSKGSHIGRFAFLWDSINGKKLPWVMNPWVWRIEYRRQ